MIIIITIGIMYLCEECCLDEMANGIWYSVRKTNIEMPKYFFTCPNKK